MPTPTGSAELSDVMKGRRWGPVPLRLKECRSMKQKVCAIKVVLTLGGEKWEHIVCKYILIVLRILHVAIHEYHMIFGDLLLNDGMVDMVV